MNRFTTELHRVPQSFNLLFIKMFKRKIFSVSSVSSVVNKTQKQMNKESSVLLFLCLKKTPCPLCYSVVNPT